MASSGNKNINAKLALLGDVGAGKSSLVLRFVKGQFIEYRESTIGAAFFSQTVAVNDATVKFEIWDTAGQERYHSLAPMYYRGAAAAIIVYDITNQASFDRAKKWVQELQAQGNSNMVMALAGNKSDLLDARKVAAEEEQTYTRENGLFFMETSAKTANNVNDMFYEIAKKLPVCRWSRTHQAWFLWIDPRRGQPVLLVAHEMETRIITDAEIIFNIAMSMVLIMYRSFNIDLALLRVTVLCSKMSLKLYLLDCFVL